MVHVIILKRTSLIILNLRGLKVKLMVDWLHLSKYWLNFKSRNNVIKKNVAFGNNLGFQAQIVDLGLKYCILVDDSHNGSSGRIPLFPGVILLDSHISSFHPLLMDQ